MKNLFKFLFGGRKAVNKTVSETTKDKTNKENFMDNEKTVTETKTEEEVKPTETKKDEVTPTETKETEVETTETKTEEEVKTEPTITETEESGNGINIEDVVTKDYLSEMLSGLMAKIDAIIKENGDLKDKLMESNGKVEEMQDKYENKDFGNVAKKGVQSKDTKSNDTFEEYSKQFM